jgi:hypothetical protein
MLLKIYYLISTLLIPFYSIYINRRIKLKKEDQEGTTKDSVSRVLNVKVATSFGFMRLV